MGIPGVALLVLDQPQPEVDLDLGLDLPPTGPESSLAWQLQWEKKNNSFTWQDMLFTYKG